VGEGATQGLELPQRGKVKRGGGSKNVDVKKKSQDRKEAEKRVDPKRQKKTTTRKAGKKGRVLEPNGRGRNLGGPNQKKKKNSKKKRGDKPGGANRQTSKHNSGKKRAGSEKKPVAKNTQKRHNRPTTKESSTIQKKISQKEKQPSGEKISCYKRGKSLKKELHPLKCRQKRP